MSSGPAPLERLLSRWHVASRTAARDIVRAGRIAVGGRICLDPRRWVDPATEALTLDGAPLAPVAAEIACWILNKPRGTVTTTSDPEGRPTVMDLIPAPIPPGLAPAGRLDRASAGLLLLTNDHDLAARLLDPASHVAKRYRVKVRGHPSADALARLRADTVRDGAFVLGPIDVVVESLGPRSAWLDVRLCEGKNRQIRRRLAAEGYAVEHLIRLELGPLVLGELAPGAVRALSAEEEAALRAAVARAAGETPVGPGRRPR